MVKCFSIIFFSAIMTVEADFNHIHEQEPHIQLCISDICRWMFMFFSLIWSVSTSCYLEHE